MVEWGPDQGLKFSKIPPSSETLILEEKESVTSDERVLRNLQNVGSFDIIHIV